MEENLNKDWSADKELSYQVTMLIMKINLADPTIVGRLVPNKLISDADKRDAFLSFLKQCDYSGHVDELAGQFSLDPDLLYDQIASFYVSAANEKNNTI